MSLHLLPSSITRRLRDSVRSSLSSTTPVDPQLKERRFSEFVEVSYDDFAILSDDADLNLESKRSACTSTTSETCTGSPPVSASFFSRVGASITRRRSSIKSRLFSSHYKASSQDRNTSLGHLELGFPRPPSYIPAPVPRLYDDSTRNNNRQLQQGASFYAQSNTSSASRIKSAFRVTYHAPSNKAVPREPLSPRNEAFLLPPQTHRPRLALEPLTELNLFSGESPSTALHPPILFRTSFAGASETTTPIDRPSQEQNFLTVDPQEFTGSPSPFHTAQPLSAISARSSFAPPSPSWLSRNIWEPQESAEDIDFPESPLPLPIPPPRLRERYSYSDEGSPLSLGLVDNDTLVGSADNSPSTLYFKLTPATPSPEHSPSSYASVRSLPALDTPSSHNFTHPARLSRSISLTNFHHEKLAESSSAAFPPPELELFAPDFFDLSPGVSSALSSLCTEFGISLHLTSTTPERTMDYFGKRNDVVDFGGEANYENMQWFKDPPPPRTPAPPPLAQTPANAPPNYRPSPDVIVQNEAFDYALKAAPSILHQRMCEFGQLGVLAWCAEFAELIDNIKQLGYKGQMFVETRTQALKTCEDLLKLKLDVQMQIIVMFLVHQVTRMRRFLDGNRQWDDYPEIQFPDPRAYGAV